ncbi:uncharacterized protein [Dendrobates tinctorius]|uniref:uncharacterized protein n=1 Tax=Dendrobates tinctorius TaxID=92724 RepID=UPI003CCA296B
MDFEADLSLEPDMELFTSEDLPNKTVTRSANEIKNKCTSNVATTNEAIYHHEFSQSLHQEVEFHESIITAESSVETSLHRFTMESNIDNTAELLPSGGIHSHHHGIKTAVSETSPPQLTSTGFNPKGNVDLIKDHPSSSSTYCQGKELRIKSTKKLAQPGLDLPEGVLDMGGKEPHDNVTSDLYSDGTNGIHLETQNCSEDIEQIANLERKADDHEDLYADSNLYERKQRTFAFDFRQELRLKMEMTDDTLLKSKVWNVPNPAKKHRKLSGMKLEPGNVKQIESTKEGDYIQTGHGKNDEETFILKNTEHKGQINGPHRQDVVTSQTFIDVPTDHVSNATDDIRFNELQDNKTSDDITVKHAACYADQTQKMSHHGFKEENQCEGEAANDKTLKDEVYLKTVNNKNNQKLDVESNASKSFNDNASSKVKYDSISGITGMCPLGINSSKVTFLSLQDENSKNMDKPQGYFKTLSSEGDSLCLEGISCENINNPSQGYCRTLSSDGDSLSLGSRSIEDMNNPSQRYLKTLSSDRDSQPSPQPNIPTLASQDLENPEYHPQICSNIVVIGRIENNDWNARVIDILRNNITDQLEFQKNGALLTICSEKEYSEQSLTPQELSSSQCYEINSVSSESDLISTGSATVNDGIARKISSKGIIKDFNDTGQSALADEHHAKHEPPEEHQEDYFVIDQEDQISSNNLSVNKHCRRDKINIIEITMKPVHSHAKNSGTTIQKEFPEKEDSSEIVLQARSNRNHNDSVTSSKMKSNESLQINSSPISIRSVLSINSSNRANKTTCALSESSLSSPIKFFSPCEFDEFTSTFPDASNQNLKNFPDISHQCKPISVHSLDHYNNISLDLHNKWQSTRPHALYQSKSNSFNLSEITLDDSPNQCTVTISDLNHSMVSLLDPSSQFRTTVQESSFESTITCLETSDQFTSISQNSTYKDPNKSSDSSAFCTTTPSDPFFHHRNNTSLSSYQGNLNSIQTSDQCSIINSDFAFNCSTSLNISDFTSRLEYNSPDFPELFTSSSSGSSNNCYNIAPDPFNQCTPSILDSTYKRKNGSFHQLYSSDSSNLCTMTSSDPSDPCKHDITQLLDQVKIKCLDTVDQCSTTSPDSTLQHTGNSVNPFEQCTTYFSDLTNHCKNKSSDLSHQCTITSSDLANYRPVITPDSAHDCGFTSGGLSDKYTTTSSHLTYEGTKNIANLSNQCVINCSTLSKQSTSPHSSDQYTIISPDAPVQCTTTAHPTYQCTTNSLDQSDQCTTIALDSSDQCTTIALDSSDQCTTIALDSSDQCTTIALDSSDQCTTIALDSCDQCTTITLDSCDQCTTIALDSCDQCTTIALDSCDQCTTIALDSSDQCTTIALDSSDQCTTIALDSSDQCTTIALDSCDQCTTIALDSSDQCTTIALDSSDQCTTIALDSSDQCTTIALDSSDQCTTIALDSSDQCTTIALDSSDQCTTIALDSCDQCTTIALDSCDQCTTIALDSSDQCTTIALDSSDQCTTIALDSSDQCTTIALDSSDQCTTISLYSYKNIPSLLNSYQHTCSPTPSHHFLTNSYETSDLHTNASDPSCQTPLPDLRKQCVINTENQPLLCNINSDQSLNVSASDISDSRTKDPIYEFKTTSSRTEEMESSHGSSFQCTFDLPNGINQLTKNSPNQCNQYMDNANDPSNRSSTCHQNISTSDASRHCVAYSNFHTVSEYDLHKSRATTLQNSSQQSTTSPPDLHISSDPDLPGRSATFFSDSDLPESSTTINPITICQDTITSMQSSDQCTNIFVNSQLSEYNIDCRSFKEPTQDEYGRVIKQHECSFLGEVRRIYLDNQGKGFSLLDSGIVLRKRVHRWKNVTLMIMRNGKELGTVIKSSQLFLYYQLGKHFYVTHQLNEDWYHTRDRITKETMLMKKVPLTSNWLKTLHNFLCLPSDHSLLIPYAVITDRNGSVLFLMEDRDVLGVGTPPSGFTFNTMENLSRALCFMRYCRIQGVLPRKIPPSVLYTPQGICFDPSSLSNNEDVCEFNKCLKKCLLVFLFDGQQEELDGTVDLLLDRAELLLEEDWSPQICVARLLSASLLGPFPFCLPFC